VPPDSKVGKRVGDCPVDVLAGNIVDGKEVCSMPEKDVFVEITHCNPQEPVFQELSPDDAERAKQQLKRRLNECTQAASYCCEAAFTVKAEDLPPEVAFP